MHDPAVQSIRLRLGATLATRGALAWGTLAAFLWGAGVVAVRLALPEAPTWLWAGAGAAACVALAAAVLGWRSRPSADAVRAMLDRRTRAGGFYVASAETPLGGWTPPQPKDLAVSWNARRPVGLFAAALGFVAFAFLFPQSLATWAEETLHVGADVKQLVGKIDLLREEKMIDPQRAELFKEKLQKLEDESSGRNPAKTLESLHHVRDQVQKAAREAAEAATKKSESLGKPESLAQGLKQTQGELDAKVEKEAIGVLNALAAEALAESDLAELGLDPELLKDLAESKLTPEELDRLAKALKGAKKGLGEKLGKLVKAKLIDVDDLAKCEKAGECDCDVVALLKSCKGGH